MQFPDFEICSNAFDAILKSVLFFNFDNFINKGMVKNNLMERFLDNVKQSGFREFNLYRFEA